MHENQSGKVIKDSTAAQISAAVFYQAHVMAKLMDSKTLSQEFAKTMFNQIDKDFGNYVDAQARLKSKELHQYLIQRLESAWSFAGYNLIAISASNCFMWRLNP